MLWLQLAAGIGGEQLARIEEVRRDRAAEHLGKDPGEIGGLGTPPAPEGVARGNLREAQDLFDATIAVRRHHEDVARQPLRVGARHADDDVVVELALRPVFEKLEGSDIVAQKLEQLAERSGVRERSKPRAHVASVDRGAEGVEPGALR